MRTACLFLVVLFAGFAVSAERAFTASGVATGDVVLRFSAASIAAEVTGSVRLAGSLEIDGRSIRFTASGTASGVGNVSLATLDLTAWIVLDATGRTADGESLTLRGGLTIDEIRGRGSGGTAGDGAGRFEFALTTESLRLRVRGTAVGSASGRFVVPRIEFAMQVDGEAAFDLDGQVFDSTTIETCEPPDAPLAPSTWPEELAEVLRQYLSHSLDESPV